LAAVLVTPGPDDPEGPIPCRGGRYDFENALDGLAQHDAFPDTKYDEGRCAANSTVAALLARGAGQFKADLALLAKNAAQKGGPEAAALGAEVKDILGKADKGGFSAHDLSLLSDKRYATF